MPALGPADIARTIKPATLARGRSVHARGQVIEVGVNDSVTIILARARGSEPGPYQQMITLQPGKKGVVVHGSCSCPVQSDSKHVAAVLIEVEQRALQPPVAVSVPLRLTAGTPSGGARRSSGSVTSTVPVRTAPRQTITHRRSDQLIYVLAFEPARNGLAPSEPRADGRQLIENGRHSPWIPSSCCSMSRPRPSTPSW